MSDQDDPMSYDDPDPSTSPIEDAAKLEEQELAALKAKADLVGVKYHPNISLAKLSERMQMIDDDDVVKAAATKGKVETPQEFLVRLKKEANLLKRIRVTCMNPAKSEWEGEIFSAGNSKIGMITKYVPFEVEWHVPQIIYNMLKERSYQTFFTVTNKQSGQKGRKGKVVKEFAIEDLPPLTADQLKGLAQRQAMAKGTAEAA